MKMENWEIQSMKDDMSILSHDFRGTEVGQTLNKAWEYINYLENKLVEVANDKKIATKLLVENDYIVTKLSKEQLNDAKECENCGFNGDCTECSCSICIVH